MTAFLCGDAWYNGPEPLPSSFREVKLSSSTTKFDWQKGRAFAFPYQSGD